MNIVIFDQDYVDAYEESVLKVLHVLEASGALVTDESQVYDFLLPIINVDEQEDHVKINNDMLEELSVLVGRSVTGSDLIWQLARGLEEHRPHVYH